MDWNRVEGKLKRGEELVMGKVKERRGKLTDDDLSEIQWKAAPSRGGTATPRIKPARTLIVGFRL